MAEVIKGVYHPRNPRSSPLYQLVEDYCEDFENRYEDLYEREYGYWRQVIHDVLSRFQTCADLRQGFARVRCPDCGNEYLLAFLCCVIFGIPGIASSTAILSPFSNEDCAKRIIAGFLSSADAAAWETRNIRRGLGPR